MANKKERFLWGAATSSHQVEGDNRLNDWWEWESLGKVKERSGLACDHYRRFKDDFAMAKGLGHNAHRFSLEWSRLEPEEGVWDDAAWGHYREVVGALRSLAIEPMVTLNHFTLPLWLYRKGGWLYERSAERFERFARKAVEVLGPKVEWWMTVNEPVVYAFGSYWRGHWPPGTRDWRTMFLAIAAQVRAHARAYRGMHETARRLKLRPIRVGMAQSVTKFFPCDPRSPLDRFAAGMRARIYNHMFIWAAMTGWIMPPAFRPERLAASRTLDFIGVNYYSIDHVKYIGMRLPRLFGEPCYAGHHSSADDWKNSLGWMVYPKGLYDMAKELARYGRPLVVTENGICTPDDGQRSRFIGEHVEWLSRAAREGVPVAGYLYWSLMDNFEWADGYGPRFGIVEVDYTTQVRRPRESAHRLAAEIARCFPGSAD